MRLHTQRASSEGCLFPSHKDRGPRNVGVAGGQVTPHALRNPRLPVTSGAPGVRACAAMHAARPNAFVRVSRARFGVFLESGIRIGGMGAGG